MRFTEKLLLASQANDSLLCIGLDIDLNRVPAFLLEKDDPIFEFNRIIIDSTADLVCAYKPNLAFYEALGMDGLKALVRTVRYVPSHIPVIGDAKRGDIGHSSEAYARAAFDMFGFDAVTVSPYLGHDSVQPFLNREDKAAFVLCKTSNPGSRDFQDLRVEIGGGKETEALYERVAMAAREWNSRGNCGLVVGATYPSELRRVREVCPDMPILIPGIGAQAGDLEAAVTGGVDAKGELAVINASRAIIYASQLPDFGMIAREVASALRNGINAHRPHRGGSLDRVRRP